jgi:probable HAF family extracellular repeat protein
MKFRTWMLTLLLALFDALAVPVGMAAQDNSSQDHKPKHHQYKLIDMGTFGGPASYTLNNGAGTGSRVLNNRGTLAGWADTSTPDPYAPNCSNPDCFVGHTFRWDDGVLTDLGALPGVNNSAGYGINERGWIAGVSENGAIDPLTQFPESRAVLWTDHQMINLGTLGGYESLGIYVNDGGQVIGLATINGTPDPYSFLGAPTHTFIWQNGVMQDLGTLGGPDSFPSAGGINQRSGLVAGGSYTNSTPNPVTGIPTQDPFLWRNGQMLDLGTLGGANGFAAVANSQGQVVGQSNLAGDLTYHPFLWDKKKGLIDLGTFGGSNGLATWINDAGEVAGEADFPGDATHDAFLWRRGALLDLGNLGVTSYGYAINSNTQVVGASRIDATPGNARAFLWENGGPMVDLNTLIPSNSSLLLAYAVNINDQGEIAGLGVPAGCQPADYLLCGHAYVLIPDGDCDDDCEGRIAATRNNAAPAQDAAAMKQGSESLISPIERFRSTMRQRYHLPGQPSAPRD